jgi:hypothetical protein
MTNLVSMLALVSVIVLAPSAVLAGPAAEPKPAQWSRTMQDLNKTLSELMTDVSSDQRFAAPANQARIERNAKKLASLAHSLKGKAAGSPDPDPTISMVGELFSEEADRAYKSFKWGHKPYARDLIRGMSSYCIACHTRNGSGPSFGNLPMNPAVANLKASERGEFFAATRQFDRALSELDSVIGSADAAKNRPIEWINSVRHSLAIAVRVKQDPELALKVVDRAIATRGVPFFFRKDAEAWRRSLLEWQKEPKRMALEEAGYHAEAVRLLMQAHELQKYPTDRSADVLYLRASAAVHDLLQKAPNGEHAPEGYLMAGLCYDVLRPYRLSELHEMYYESCIRKAPHTPLAEGCYDRLEQSVYEGFTGSGGTDIPADAQKRLDRLNDLALPKGEITGAAPR